MDKDIEFLRELGEDLRQAASEHRRRGVPRWRGRPLLAVVPILLVLATAGGLLLSTLPSTPDGLGTPDGATGAGTARLLPGRGSAALVPLPSGQMLYAVDAAGPDGVWAVGIRRGGDGSQQESLILRWNGSSWSEIPHPDIGDLRDVVAVSSHEAWAVGGERQILRWDGSVWTESHLPHVEGMFLTAIDGSGPRDIWAVGIRFGATWTDKDGDHNIGYDTLTLHWDGTQWTLVPSPNAAPRTNYLEGVVALAKDDAWAVGYSQEGDVPRTMTMHWDGTSWDLVPSPNPGHDLNVLWGAGDDSQNGIWAVGHYGDPDDSPIMALYLRWTGNEWAVVPGPVGKPLHHTPTALSGKSATDVWAVGSEPTSSLLIARWDGSGWAPLPVEFPGRVDTSLAALTDVVAISPTEAWAVGRYQIPSDDNGRTRTLALALRWDGATWRPAHVPDPFELTAD